MQRCVTVAANEGTAQIQRREGVHIKLSLGTHVAQAVALAVHNVHQKDLQLVGNGRYNSTWKQKNKIVAIHILL